MPKKIYFWQSDCLSNLASLYGLCILHSSFLYWPLLCRGYLISIAYCPFFHFVQSLWKRQFSKSVVVFQEMLLFKIPGKSPILQIAENLLFFFLPTSNSDTRKYCCNYTKIWTMQFYHRDASKRHRDPEQEHSDEHLQYRSDTKFSDRYAWANSADPDQTAPRGAVWSRSTLFGIPPASFGFITLW